MDVREFLEDAFFVFLAAMVFSFVWMGEKRKERKVFRLKEDKLMRCGSCGSSLYLDTEEVPIGDDYRVYRYCLNLECDKYGKPIITISNLSRLVAYPCSWPSVIEEDKPVFSKNDPRIKIMD